MKLSFHGGAKSVTGSNYLLESASTKILIDCGLFQGSRYAEDLNYNPFPFAPSEIEAVIITHSHTDHTGRLPKLHKDGFRGSIYASTATVDLIKVALPDNYDLMKDDAAERGLLPLFSNTDMTAMFSQLVGVDYGAETVIGDIKIKLHDAGHILGSSIIEINVEGKKIYFSGDLGNPPNPLLNEPSLPSNANYIVTESTYGDRIHEDREERKSKLTKIIQDSIARGGTLMIPTFAMERTQELLYELNGLINERQIANVPIFLDSPLAIKLTKVYGWHTSYLNEKARQEIKSGDDIFNFPGLKFTVTVDESKAINNVSGPKIVIAGSGMSSGGRILHHEKRYLPDPNSAILFIGYQAEGSLGRKIFDARPTERSFGRGATEVKIFGEIVSVNCRVEAIGGYSAHADQKGLMAWIGAGAEGKNLKKVFVVQGESHAAEALADKIKQDLSIEAVVPDANQSFEI